MGDAIEDVSTAFGIIQTSAQIPECNLLLPVREVEQTDDLLLFGLAGTNEGK